jgi:hypothetical protein
MDRRECPSHFFRIIHETVYCLSWHSGRSACLDPLYAQSRTRSALLPQAWRSGERRGSGNVHGGFVGWVRKRIAVIEQIEKPRCDKDTSSADVE